jgi:hypothetical protein
MFPFLSAHTSSPGAIAKSPGCSTAYWRRAQFRAATVREPAGLLSVHSSRMTKHTGILGVTCYANKTSRQPSVNMLTFAATLTEWQLRCYFLRTGYRVVKKEAMEDR